MLGKYSIGMAVPASDLNRACDFYENVLGCKVLRRTEQYVSFQSGDNQFMVYPTEYAGTAKNTIGGWEVDDFDSTVNDLRSKGIKLEDYDQPGLKTKDGIFEAEGMRACWFKDTEGNILAVNGK